MTSSRQSAPIPESFRHRLVTASGVIRSRCSRCGMDVAYSPKARLLVIAEEAHHCNTSGKTTEEQAPVPPQL